MKWPFVLWIFVLLLSTSSCTYYFGHSFMRKAAGRDGNLHLQVTDRPGPETTPEQLNVGLELLQHFANQPLPEDWRTSRTPFSRTVYAKLTMNQDIEAVNKYLMESQVVGNSGSSGFLNPKGDYDFREISYAGILWMFGNDPAKLYPETVQHIVCDLLIECGGKPKLRTPHTLKLMRDTENHILMTEISRYLRNQWIFEHTSQEPDYDNKANGLEEWMVDHLNTMLQTGAYEFNANPYMGYTLSALLTLQGFAHSDTVKALTTQILDELNWEYALGSNDFRTFHPYRRRLERADRTFLSNDPHSAMLKVWYYKYTGRRFTMDSIPGNYHQALMAMLMPYQIPKEVYDWLDHKPSRYFVQIGHGVKACPEIISGGPDFVLSAGGTRRRKFSQIIPRPINLILNDTVTDIRNTFHINGKGDLGKWQQTGVYDMFAVGEQPVQIPAQYTPVVIREGWQIFDPYGNGMLYVAVYNQPDLGIIMLFDYWKYSVESLAENIITVNQRPGQLHHACVFPKGDAIEYDLKAPKGKWVITAVNGQPTDRNYDKWPRHQGWID